MKKSDRAIAVAVLSEIMEGGAYANIALRKALAQSETTPQARAFITEMVNETLRNIILIDHIIGSFSNTPTSELKPIIRNILRISVCQIRFLERIPERAAVDEAVKLTKQHNFERLSGFVNAILRSIVREPEKPQIHPKDLALRFSYPAWMINSLIKWLGSKGAIEFCENSHKPASITVLPNTCKTDVETLTAALKAEDVDVFEKSVQTRSTPMLTLRHTGDITRLIPFKEGHFIVTDPGAMAAVDALAAKPGQKIIDMCAAPGGKSFATAFQMQNEGRILAFDIHPHRIELIRQTQKRLGLTIIEPSVQDATVFNPDLVNTADAVLVDAPCSGLGTIRKHPEIKFTRQPEDIQILAKKQARMLENAAKYVKPGGKLVYCTCTVAAEENMDIINSLTEAVPNYEIESTEQTLPSAEADGFFTAVMLRRV
ncbi:MAG: 16S rRNA (cytosine(967)-C(5))-methyltransferase RsmB [Defluviitaleaceae bacterium]|nr:16S rRNA (cytosine(967)-C(5))-methyltransferase RsmB [Defluviitaleaceae bacterium]